MGTHSEEHINPVKKELLGTRQLLYHNRLYLILKDLGSPPFTRESRLLSKKFTLSMMLRFPSENEVIFHIIL